MEGGLDAIVFGDLDAKKNGKDETNGCSCSQDNYMLVTTPVDGIVLTPEFGESKKGPNSEEEEEGQKHRR